MNTRNPCAAWCGVFLTALVLYAATANRGAQWQDSGYHILRIVTEQPLNPLGLALSHPLHHWLGRFAVSLNLLEPCLAITLVSALAAAIAVANTFGCVVVLTRQWHGALLAASSLAVAHTFWQMATLAETYTLAAALLSGECWLLALYGKSRRPVYLWGALLLNGLGVSNHMLASLTTVVLAAVVLHQAISRAIRLRDVAAGAALWLIGATPYIIMVVNEWCATQDFGGSIRSALFGHGYGPDVLNTKISQRSLLIGVAFVVLCFPNLLLPAAAYGVGIAGRSGVPVLVKLALLAGLIIHAVFALRYPVVDQHTFFLPMYVLLSIFAGIGFAGFLEQVNGSRRVLVTSAAWAMIGLTPCLYAVLPDLARNWGVLEAVERHKPYRDDYVYVFTPWSVAERSAERMSREAVTLASPYGTIVVEDRMAEFAVRYQARNIAPDRLQIVRDPNWHEIGLTAELGRSVVLVPANVDRVPNPPVGCFWSRSGDLFVLKPITRQDSIIKPTSRKGQRDLLEPSWDCGCPLCRHTKGVPQSEELELRGPDNRNADPTYKPTP